MSQTAAVHTSPARVAPRLSFLDRYLTLSIFPAMGAGIALGDRLAGVVLAPTRPIDRSRE